MNKIVCKLPALMALLITSMWLSSANASSLIGTTVTLCADTVYSGTVTSDPAFCDTVTAQPMPTSAIVSDPGVEFSLTNTGSRLFDFSDNILSITYNNVTSASADLYVFGLENLITGLTLLTPDPLNITTTFNNNFLGILVNDPLFNGTVQYELTVAAIPVPAAAWLFGSALLGFFGFSRKKANA